MVTTCRAAGAGRVQLGAEHADLRSGPGSTVTVYGLRS